MELKDGVWLLPLRGRPAGLKRLIRSVQATEPEARVVAILDEGDPECGVLEEMLERAGWAWFPLFGSPSTVVKLNAGVEMCPDEGFYGLLASDIEPQTVGWGKALAAACPPFGLSYCDDSIHQRNLPTHPCVSGELVRALGWWAYPKAMHNGVDIYLYEVASLAGGAEYVEGHSFMHHHHSAGRAAPDELTQRVAAWGESDRIASIVWKDKDGVLAAMRVRKVQQCRK